MRDGPQIVIEPKTWKGWTLTFHESHDRKSDYSAERGGVNLFAPSLDELMEKIRDTEQILLRLPLPLKIFARDRYGHSSSLKEAQVHTIHNQAFIYTGADGTYSGSMHELNAAEDKATDRKYFLDTPENRAKRTKADALDDRASKMHGEASRLRRSLRPLTEADVRLAAGVPTR